LLGGEETAADNAFSLTTATVHEVLRTGVFRASGLIFTWLHKSYSEFLAAYHLRTRGVSNSQIIKMISCAGRVVPALHGVTAWLTSKDQDLFRRVLRLDPEVLLSSDLSAATDQQRADLVDWLLGEAERDSPLVHEWGMYWTYRKLRHAGLKLQLESVIELLSSVTQRFCAIEIAHACNGAGLSGVLTDFALRENEPLSLRTEAAYCVADHGSEADKARLLPLAVG
jgi:hypothetical protein